jgi:hypothetical protein
MRPFLKFYDLKHGEVSNLKNVLMASICGFGVILTHCNWVVFKSNNSTLECDGIIKSEIFSLISFNCAANVFLFRAIYLHILKLVYQLQWWQWMAPYRSGIS